MLPASRNHHSTSSYRSVSYFLLVQSFIHFCTILYAYASLVSLLIHTQPRESWTTCNPSSSNTSEPGCFTRVACRPFLSQYEMWTLAAVCFITMASWPTLFSSSPRKTRHPCPTSGKLFPAFPTRTSRRIPRLTRCRHVRDLASSKSCCSR
jgi:hypothetical protein